MAEIDSKTYPQKVEGVATKQAPIPGEVKGPAFFKNGENILFMALHKVLAVQILGNKIRLTCQTIGKYNATTYTHETSLHQFSQPSEAIVGQLEMELDFWSETIFRVRFAERRLSEDVPAFPDKKGRMLIGAPDSDFKLTDINENSEQIVVKTSQIELHISKEPFDLKAYDSKGRMFWSQRRSDLFTADIFDTAIAKAEDRTACFEAFSIGSNEEIFGLGERFDYVARRGKNVDFWNKDAIGTSNRRTYINVPFLFSTNGYGLFLNSSYRTEWEIGTLEASTLGFAVEASQLDYFVIYGPTPAQILQHYWGLTGFAPLPPIWSFGLWMSRNSYESWEVVEEVANELRAREIPTDVLHLDTAWFQEDWNCDLRFATDRFAEPEKHIQNLKAQGFRVSLWQYNFVPRREDNINYREGIEKGYFALGSDRKVFAYPAGVTGSWIDDAIIDFSNPAACEWYANQIKALIRLGAATIKTDFGEGIPEDAVFQNIEGRCFHNLYSLVYNSVIASAITEVSGENVVWARSGTAGSQRYPIHWGGDSQCSWSGMSGSLRAALSLGLSGIPFFSHDIGGFIGKPDPELYIRWAQFGLLSGFARCHGAGNHNSREPWSFGEEANRIFKHYAQLRYRLLPYIYNEARKCTKTGKPMIRALVLEYPQDLNSWHIEDQYLLGDSLLIAPIFAPLAEAQTRILYLPKGTWFDYWTKETKVSQGEWIEQELNLETMPIYVKAGSVLPYGTLRQNTENKIGIVKQLEVYTDGVTNFAYDYDDGVTTFGLSYQSDELTLNGFVEDRAFKIKIVRLNGFFSIITLE